MAMSARLPAATTRTSWSLAINTTPLVDVMLVLLIIFLITDPGGDAHVPVALAARDEPADQDQAGEHHDGGRQGRQGLLERCAGRRRCDAARQAEGPRRPTMPQPEVHIRGDQDARYEFIGRVVAIASAPASPRSPSSSSPTAAARALGGT